jgi:NAD+ kinase
VNLQLIRRGSDYESLLAHHSIHSRSRDHVRQVLEEAGAEVRVVNRFEYNEEQIDWADVIITAGGDGTFLMAASKIFSSNKPVIGINSDPSRSVGYLCLDPSYSMDFRSALDRLQSGRFRWVYRQRIRVSIKGESSLDPPAELHNQQLMHPEFRYLDLETHPLNRRSNSPPRPDPSLNPAASEFNSYHVLPVRALNDVFVGECLSSRVSYFEFAVDDRQSVKVKSSGVTICTGTGSTSWSFNINKISPQSVQTLFSLIKEETGVSLDLSNQPLVRKLTKRFNDSLIFDVCDKTMAYTVRDPVYMGNEFDTENRGFTRKISIKSRMFDACVVIDGGLSYAFNDGAYARFELLDEDQLQTIAFD